VSQSPPTPAPPPSPLREIARLFLKLGATAFGGPAAHIAMMEEEVVRRRQWLTREEFLDLLGATNLIPGPNSTEMAIHIGHRRGGRAGLIVAGTCFIVPATIIVLGVAWAYVRYGSLPQFAAIFRAVNPVILAVILQALWGLGRAAVRTPALGVLGAAALVAGLCGAHELLILLAAAVVVPVVRSLRRSPPAAPLVALPLLPRPEAAAASDLLAGAPPAAAGALALAVGSKVYPLFWFFLKVGSVLYGSGYVLVAFLQAELVERRAWLTEGQLLDAVAVGQFTPGPVFTTATFIGYLLGDVPGALMSTVGIFLPAFVFVAAIGPFVPRLRRSPTAAAALDGVNVASLALMAQVAILLGGSALTDVRSVATFLIAAVLLVRFRINSAWLVLTAAAMGFALGM
jgi:chromate transporter